MSEFYFDFTGAAIFLLVAAALVFVTLLVARLVRPQRPTEKKLTVYECGEIPLGSPWVRYNIRFYNVALVFLIFDVELVMLYPVAVALLDFKQVGRLYGLLALLEILVFVIILVFALIYAWRWGNLDWLRSKEDKFSASPSSET